MWKMDIATPTTVMRIALIRAPSLTGVNLSILLFLSWHGSSYSPQSNLFNHLDLDDLPSFKKLGKFDPPPSPEEGMVGQIFGSHHTFHPVPPLVNLLQFSHTIGSEMEMWVSKSATVEMGFKGHILEKDLAVRIDFIIFLEKGSIVRVQKPDTEPVPR